MITKKVKVIKKKSKVENKPIKRKKVKETSWIKIDPSIKIADLIEAHPELMEILTYEYGLHCINCFISEFDTLKEGARIHGIEGKYFDEMLSDIEKVINNPASTPAD